MSLIRTFPLIIISFYQNSKDEVGLVGRLSEYQYVLRNLPTSTDPQWITAAL